ncbi:MAG: HAD-IIA family hydrolase [Oscillospiraceae bacterium]|nr:HAD-IIA family hydrolase [Oscillospiraceae bacterium]
MRCRKELAGSHELEALRSKRGFLCDMDGVIYHGNRLLAGVPAFVRWLEENGKRYLFLTNGSGRTPLALQQKLSRMGLEVDASKFYTSALATARFLQSQSPGCSAYIIGESGLFNALREAGIAMNDSDPDYVVVGETHNYSYDMIARAVHHVRGGAKLIGTNSDLTDPGEHGIVPACRALIAPIELASERKAYFIGKPNALMMRTGLRMLGVHTSEAVIIGDRMDTDIVGGIETGMDTVLALSGVTDEKHMRSFPYCPQYILNGVGDIAGDNV